MSYKAVVSRVTAEGETFQVEVIAKHEAELANRLEVAGKCLDHRLHQQNLRIIAAHQRMQKLDHDSRLVVHEIFQLLNGKRMPKPGEMTLQIAAGQDAQDSAADQMDAENGGNPYQPHPGLDSITKHVDQQRAGAVA